MPTRRKVLHYAGLASLMASCQVMRTSSSSETSQDWDSFPLTIKSSGRLIMKSSAGYDQSRIVINPRIDMRPAAIAYCNNQVEVAQVVKWARSNGHKITVRSGGHSYEGYSMNTDLVIDISNLKNFELNKANMTMNIGAGWKQGELAERLLAAMPNTAAVMGSCKTVGLSGFALGGGFGFLSRKHGLGADNIVSLTMVNAQGELIYANANNNTELFWALRGGGCGSFGIVTAMEYRVHPVPSTVTTFYRKFPLDDAKKIVPLWFDWIKEMDPNIVSIMSINGGVGEKSLRITGQFLGNRSNFLSKVLPSEGIIQSESMRERSFSDSLDYFNGGKDTARESRWRARSDFYLKPLNNEGIDAISKIVSAQGNPWGFAFIFDSYGPVIRSIAGDATAFAHRTDILACMQLYMSWGDTKTGPNSQDGNSIIRLNAIGQALKDSGNVSGRAYPNYADATRTDWPSAYYAQNLERLKKAKTQFDPENYFSFPQSIPLA